MHIFKYSTKNSYSFIKNTAITHFSKQNRHNPYKKYHQHHKYHNHQHQLTTTTPPAPHQHHTSITPAPQQHHTSITTDIAFTGSIVKVTFIKFIAGLVQQLRAVEFEKKGVECSPIPAVSHSASIVTLTRQVTQGFELYLLW